MDLVRNLKRTLKNMVGKVLVELSCHYIRQRAKLISKRRDNSSQTEFSRRLLTEALQHSTIATSSTGTSEKITMETTIEPVVQVRDWVVQKIKDTDDYDTAIALVAEFEEWLDLDGKDEIDYLCIENDEWGDQELDVR